VLLLQKAFLVSVVLLGPSMFSFRKTVDMAAFAKVAAFLRKHTPAFAAAGLSASVILSILPQTFGLSRYRQLLSNHDSDGKETSISSDLQLLIDRVAIVILLADLN
jgi:hypothetical protein